MRTKHALRFAILGLLAGAGALLAQSTGRVHGKVLDENDKPVPGVKITITDPDVKGRLVEAVSDEIGKYQLVIHDATKLLPWRMEKQGFHTSEMMRKVPANTTTELDVRIYSLASVPPPSAGISAEEAEAARLAAEAKIKAVEAFNAGAALYKTGDLDGALGRFQEAVALDPTFAKAYAVTALVHHQKKQWVEAGAAADRAAALAPEDVKNQQLRFDAYSRLGDATKLNEAIEGLKAADPKGAAQVLYQRGESLFNAGDSAGAEAILAQAVALDPSNARAQYRYGLCLINLGKSGPAKEALQKFVELAPNDPEVATAKEMLSYLK